MVAQKEREPSIIEQAIKIYITKVILMVNQMEEEELFIMKENMSMKEIL